MSDIVLSYIMLMVASLVLLTGFLAVKRYKAHKKRKYDLKCQEWYFCEQMDRLDRLHRFETQDRAYREL